MAVSGGINNNVGRDNLEHGSLHIMGMADCSKYLNGSCFMDKLANVTQFFDIRTPELCGFLFLPILQNNFKKEGKQTALIAVKISSPKLALWKNMNYDSAAC
jgi:hypothetical protein